MRKLHFKNKNFSCGFTLVEIIVVVSIGAVLMAVALYSLSTLRNTTSLAKNVFQAKAFLEEARSLSISEKDDTNYGVQISSDRLVRFQGSTYSATSSQNITLLFDQNSSTIDTISLAGSSTQVVFKKITGGTDNYGSFRIKMIANQSSSSTVSITSTGVISSQ